ncbi:MAG: hypothetical protein ACI4D3_00895 [Lachnospiraceae bacterium]
MNEMRTDDASAAGQFAFDDDEYTDKELREQKKQFEKQLLELERLLDKDEWSDEDMDCVRSVKESVESYTDTGRETDDHEDDVYEEMTDDTAEEPPPIKKGMVICEQPTSSRSQMKETIRNRHSDALSAGWEKRGYGVCKDSGNSCSQLLPDETKSVAEEEDSFLTKYGIRLLFCVLLFTAAFLLCYLQLYSVIVVLILASVVSGIALIGFRFKRSADEKKQKIMEENSILKLWNEVLEQRNAELEEEKKHLMWDINSFENGNAQLVKQVDQLQDENRKLQKKLARMSEVQEQIRVLKILIKQIGLTNEEIEEILKMTEEVKKDFFSEERLERYIAEVLQVTKGRKESALYKKKKEYFVGTKGELFTALCEAAKDFLITAEVMYDLLQDYGSGCDYSSVCLLASKAMEVETRGRYFDSYKIYLDKQFGTDYKKWPKNMLYCGEPAAFCSMGNIRRIVTRCDHEGVSYIRKNFLIYAKQEMFRDTLGDHMEQEIRFQLDCIDSVRLKYRNPAAHSRLFTSEEAKICLCYIVEDEQVLFHIMKTYKI